jgi:thioredoxin-dependent peroxiredoxin
MLRFDRDANALAGAVAVNLTGVLEPGDQAPDFTLPDQNGDRVSLTALQGKAVVLYFYPKADTPGCTVQACGVRDHHADYDQAGAVVLGVSADPVKKIANFAGKYTLGFPLLSDEDHSVAEAYGVWVEKSMYGRTYMGNERTTFVLGADGRITEILRKVKPAEHDGLVLAALDAA